MTLKKKKSKNIIRHRMRARCFLIMVRVKGSKRRSSKGRLCHCFITAGSRARGRPTTTLTTPARAIKPCLAALYLYDYSLLDRPTSQPASHPASQPATTTTTAKKAKNGMFSLEPRTIIDQLDRTWLKEKANSNYQKLSLIFIKWIDVGGGRLDIR